jgi:hypothetical protein
MNRNLSKEVGEISHDWRGCCGGSFSVFLSSEVDNFTLRGIRVIFFLRKINQLRFDAAVKVILASASSQHFSI